VSTEAAVEHRKRALVVGASRGLGLGLVRGFLDRGWDVVATTRRRDNAALEDLARGAAGRLEIASLDVTDTGAIAGLRERIAGSRLDLLFVSAGVMNEADKPAGLETAAEFARLMETNARAPLAIIEALGADVAADGAIVAMTSVLGSVAQNTSGGYEVYRASKAALNTLLRSYASRHTDRAVIAMHPGWVRTDMGGARAALSVEDSVAGMIGVIAERLGKPGCAFLDYRGQTLPW
jgi:NAD(P)-dependent dehydrogenase (short-subunit alcohol dehydrogenase family)